MEPWLALLRIRHLRDSALFSMPMVCATACEAEIEMAQLRMTPPRSSRSRGLVSIVVIGVLL